MSSIWLLQVVLVVATEAAAVVVQGVCVSV
jgi:hypothetical protein